MSDEKQVHLKHPETGEIVTLPKSEADALERQSASEVQPDNEDQKIEQSIFEDASDFAGSASLTFASSVTIAGTEFMFNELSRADLQQVMHDNKSIQAQAKQTENAFRTASNKSKQLLEKADTPEKIEAAQAIAAQASEVQLATSEELAERTINISRSVVEKAVVGWNNPKWPKPVPCTTETRHKLTRTVATALSDAIIAKSFSGRAHVETGKDFLSR